MFTVNVVLKTEDDESRSHIHHFESLRPGGGWMSKA
jgi:hypothetical protein